MNGDVYGSRILIATPTSLSHVAGGEPGLRGVAGDRVGDRTGGARHAAATRHDRGDGLGGQDAPITLMDIYSENHMTPILPATNDQCLRTRVLLGDNPASFPYLRARARVVSCINGTDIRMFIMAGLDARGLQSKLLITSLSE